MELKTRFQYTYFVHTYLIKENRYNKYICRLLNDKRFKLRIFNKDKDLDLYTHFLPKIRNFLFQTFDLDNVQKKAKLDELPLETKAAILATYPSLTFEYNLEKDMQGKTVDDNSIFFKIQKIGLVIFKTGICFLYIKTNIEDSKEFADVLNFNYKFRDINQEYNNLKNYDNIKVQADKFQDINSIKEFIRDLTGSNVDALKLNIDVERFYTYSYTCIEQEAWNVNTSFESIKNEFLKYIEVLPNDNSTNNVLSDNIKIVSKGKYDKTGISKLAVNLLSSDTDINNYMSFPLEFENQYFYTYILSLYINVYLKKINYEFKHEGNIEATRKKFVEFTKNLWLQEVTTEDLGSIMYKYMKEVLEIEKLYSDVKNKYDILYRELKIEKNEKLSRFIVAILLITLGFNVVNLVMYLTNWLN